MRIIRNIAGRKTPLRSMRIDLVDLETFIAVAGLGSFSQAAEQLHITQPSVTSRIQRLESSLGVKLLVRTTRTVRTTPRGELLRAEAEEVLRGLRQLVDTFGRQSEAAQHQLTVASTPMLAAVTLPPIIRSYNEKYKDVQILVQDLRTGDALKSVLSGEADFAVMAFGGEDKRFRFQPVWEEEMVVLVPPNHALAKSRSASLDQIVAFPLMMLEQYSAMHAKIADEVARRGLKLQSTMSGMNLNTMLGMLDAHIGIVLLPRSMARGSQQHGHVVVEITGVKLSRIFGIVAPAKATLSTAAQRFCRHLRQAMSVQARLR